jgi:hypothetical protein
MVMHQSGSHDWAVRAMMNHHACITAEKQSVEKRSFCHSEIGKPLFLLCIERGLAKLFLTEEEHCI